MKLFEAAGNLFQGSTTSQRHRARRRGDPGADHEVESTLFEDDLIQIYRSPTEQVGSPVKVDVLEVSLGTGKVSRSHEGIVLGEARGADIG